MDQGTTEEVRGVPVADSGATLVAEEETSWVAEDSEGDPVGGTVGETLEADIEIY